MKLTNLFGANTETPWESRTVWSGFVVAACQFFKAALPDHTVLIESIQIFALAGVVFFLRAGMLREPEDEGRQ